MPKTGSKSKQKVTPVQRVASYKDDGFILNGNEISCTYCTVNVPNKKHAIEQHIATKKHSDCKNLKVKQGVLYQMKPNTAYSSDICKAFVASNIPLKKLNNPVLKKFLENYTGRRVPDESTIRKLYLEKTYNETIENIRKDIGDLPIWASVDETTDAEGRYIANIIVGKMQHETAGTPHLIHTVHLEKTNSQTIAKALNDAFEILWPHKIHHERVLILITDAAAYMKKAAREMKVFYSKMLHVTCLAHALHRLADTIRGKFKKLDSLINNVKKVFLKAPSRDVVLKEKYPDLPLPPAPVVTRWGTWLDAVKYYATNWVKIREVVDSFSPEDAAAIKAAQELFADEECFNETTIVHMHYVFISDEIRKLEKCGSSIQETLGILGGVQQKISKTPYSDIKQKLADVLDKNPGLSAIMAINESQFNKLRSFDVFKDVSPADIYKYTFAPLVSCEVERSFSRYKNVLAANRRNFKFPNLTYHLVIECNTFVNEEVGDPIVEF